MKLFPIPALLTLLMLGSISLQSCLITDHLTPSNTQVQLQQLTDSLYQHFNQKWKINKGGIFMRVSNPSGSYLVSSNVTPPVQENSHFRIASISKIFTAAAIMRLHQEDRLSINDTITKYLPNTPTYNIPYKNQITIKLLLQHRAGVFDITNQNIPQTVKQPYAGKRYSDYIRDDLKQDSHTFTLDELNGVVAQNGLFNYVPNTQFYYSNTGYHLLAKLVEQRTGLSFNDYITKTFFEPLCLTNTYGVVLGTDQRMKDPFIESFLYAPGSQTINTSENNLSINVADGNIVSTPADISRWIDLLLTGQAGISAANVALMKEMLPADAEHGVYGLGLDFKDGLGFGHDGFQASYLSTVRYNPDTKTTVLIVATFFKLADKPDLTNPISPEFLELALSLRTMGLRGAQIVNR